MNHFWTLRPGEGIDSLRKQSREFATVGPNQVAVSVQNISLNSRDLMVAFGQSPMPVGDELVPLSDASGAVMAVGKEVSLFKPGDRVVIAFNPLHLNGPFESYMAAGALGEMSQGVLSQQVIFDQSALVKIPDNISTEQAACLPCVAVTAWNALFESGGLQPGQTVLIHGTGMVSLAAMQLAKAVGARVGMTSGDDQKIAQVKALGADFVIHNKAFPEWDKQVLEATNGEGAHVVLETLGPPTIAASVRATAVGGRVMQIGLKGLTGPAINPLDLLVRQVSVIPVMVGSRNMLEKVVSAFSKCDLQIPVSKSFPFDEAPLAFASLASGENFGKTLIHTH